MHWFRCPRLVGIFFNLKESGLGEGEMLPERDINFLKKLEDERSSAVLAELETNELDDVFIL